MYGKIDKTKCFIALFCGLNEISGAGYCRAEVETGFHLNCDGVFINDTKIYFPKVLSSWGKVTHFALYNKSVKGSRVGSVAKLVKSFTIENDEFPVFHAGDFRIGILPEES